LMQHVIKWADTQGLKRLQLLADKNNEAAITFYKTQGWQSTQLNAWFKLL
jgi:GNAT superfamily N-acetyltransferase